MKKILLFFIFSKIVLAIGANDYRHCCSTINMTYSSQIGWGASDASDGDATGGKYCEQTSSTIVNVWKYEAYYNYTRQAVIACSCSLAPMPFPDRNETEWIFIAESLESSSLPTECTDSIYEIDEGVEDCLHKFKCYQKKLPFFDCTIKGEKWEQFDNASTAFECSSSVDGVVWDSGSWETGDNIQDTCCLKKADDKDSDGDGLTDKEEKNVGSDAHNSDTDADGKIDGAESISTDTDGDGVLDILESSIVDSDGDGTDDEHDYFFTVSDFNGNGQVSNNSDGSVTHTYVTSIENGATQTTSNNYDANDLTTALAVQTTTTNTTTNSDGSTTTTNTTTNTNNSTNATTTTTTNTTTNSDGSTTTNTTNTNTGGGATSPPNDNYSPPPASQNGGGGSSRLDGNYTTNSTATDNLLRELNAINAEQNIKLQKVDASVNAFSDRNHRDLGTISDSIKDNGKTLDDIKEGIKDLNSNFESNSSRENSDSNGFASDIGNIYDDGVLNITDAFNNLVSKNLGVVPAFSVSNSQCVFSSNTNIFGVIEFDLNDYIPILYPFTSLMFSLLFMFLSLKMYIWAFKIVISII